MPTTLTSSGTTLAPLAVSEYTSDQDGGAIVHVILGRENLPDVTHRPLGMRTGSFTLTFANEAATATARTALGRAGSWLLQSAERTTINMRFIVRRISRPIRTDGHWAVQVGYEEIPT